MIVMIDNYDSFTYNLRADRGSIEFRGLPPAARDQLVKELGDKITVQDALAMRPEAVLLSPGPCTPNEAGICLELLERLQGRFPILGVCLGHQAMGQAFGGRVVRARQVMHGKTSPIHHNAGGVFSGLPSPFTATRYHSLIVDKAGLPEVFEVTAWTQHEDGSMDEIMGLRHKTLRIEGVQFHPESILTEHGHAMLKNFLEGK